MTTSSASQGGYWYPQDAHGSSHVTVLNALRKYREAEMGMRQRMEESMKMNQTDLRAIRYVLQAHRADQPIGPKDLSAMLGITTASTTVLLDRLEKRGHVSRRTHPTDRRALKIIPTISADAEVRQGMNDMHQRMLSVAASLTGSEAHTVTTFLQCMATAIEYNDTPTPADGTENEDRD